MKQIKKYLLMLLLTGVLQTLTLDENNFYPSQQFPRLQNSPQSKLIVIDSHQIAAGLTSIAATYGILKFCIHKFHLQPTASNRIFALSVVLGVNAILYKGYNYFRNSNTTKSY